MPRLFSHVRSKVVHALGTRVLLSDVFAYFHHFRYCLYKVENVVDISEFFGIHNGHLLRFFKDDCIAHLIIIVVFM